MQVAEVAELDILLQQELAVPQELVAVVLEVELVLEQQEQIIWAAEAEVHGKVL